MSYSAIENTDIVIDLVDAAIQTGWTGNGTSASHSGCNESVLPLNDYPLTIGVSYEYTFDITAVSGLTLFTILGTNEGATHTTTGEVHETVVANGTQLYIFADGVCTIENFVIRPVLAIADNKAQNTISFSEKTRKWVSFYSYIPTNAFPLFTDVFSFDRLSDLYVHESGSNDRNNFFGVQYQSIIQFVDAVAPAVPKTFQSLSIQCNELMITTSQGIQTSLGQLSELASVDFIKDFLTDGVSQVNVFNLEGVYAANFLRDINSPGGLLDGNPLKGNYLLVELISTNNEPLLLYTINVVATHSPVGSR